MAATRPPAGGVRAAPLAVLFVALLLAVAAEAVLLAGSAGQTVSDGPPAAVARRSETPAPDVVPVVEGTEDGEMPPEAPAITPAPVESTATAAAVTPPDDAGPTESSTTPPPADRPAAVGPAPRWTADDLRASLLHVPEIGLLPPNDPTVPRTGRAGHGVHPLLALIDARPDLHGLPVRPLRDVQLPPVEAEAFRDTSVVLRKAVSELIGRGGPANRRLAIHPEVIAARPQMFARVLHQMLQVETVGLRKLLLAKLVQIHNPAATKALAHRAVYEPSAELRQTAVRALADRPAAEYLPPLLDAFRNPWPPAADYAADALASLAPTEAVPDLVRLLDAPDPTGPVPDEHGLPVVRELVRVNHNRNCLLCHAQSVGRGDGIRVALPNPVRPLPPPFTLLTYEGGGKGGSGTLPGTVFARPDITYLQQEFSWALPVANPGPWPAVQRFDFLVRTRPAGASDMTPTDAAPADAEFPQKRAVVRALRALTGKDFGDRPAAWRAGLAVAKGGG